MAAPSLVREYYGAIDAEEYTVLASILSREFVQIRPDRRFDGREEFVEFMRADRPITDAVHEITAMYPGEEGIAVEGALTSGDEVLFGFVDVFEIADEQITHLRTYTQ